MTEKATVRDALARVETGANLPHDRFQPSSFADAMAMADWLSKSGLTPKALQGKPQDILVIIMAAVDCGLSVYQGLQELTPINGRVTMSARLASARAASHPSCRKFAVIHSDRQKAVVRVERHDWPEGEYQDVTFSVQQAKRAGLLNNRGPWQTWLEDMLVARARTRAANQYFPEALMGFQEMSAMQSVFHTMQDAVPKRTDYDKEPASPLEQVKARVVETAPPEKIDETPDDGYEDAEIVEDEEEAKARDIEEAMPTLPEEEAASPPPPEEPPKPGKPEPASEPLIDKVAHAQITRLANKVFKRDVSAILDWLVDRTGKDRLQDVTRKQAAELEAELLAVEQSLDDQDDQLEI